MYPVWRITLSLVRTSLIYHKSKGIKPFGSQIMTNIRNLTLRSINISLFYLIDTLFSCQRGFGVLVF